MGYLVNEKKDICLKESRKAMKKMFWKRKFRITIVFCFLLALQITSTLSVNAADAETEVPTKIGLGIDSKLQPRYQVTCPDPSGRHLMRGRGTGWAYYGSYPSNDLRLTGQASQCEHCHLVLITQNNPFWGGTTCWGNYALWNPGYSVGNGVVMYTTTFGYKGTNNDPFVKGFTFN
ncbi:MAG: hypothetical protein K1W22_09085 [Lachnospiraceae bacterium]